MPTREEYLPIALLTVTCQLMSTTSFVGMGDVATKEAFDWVISDCKILKATFLVARFMNDIATHKVTP